MVTRRADAKARTSARNSSDRTIREEDLLAAKLLATLPADPGAWDDDTAFRIANFRRREFFFCPAAHALAHRAGPIAAISKKLQIGVGRQDLKSLSSGKPLTLRKIVRIQRALQEIAKSNDPKIRELTAAKASGRGGRRLAPFVLRDGDVIPSYFLLNKRMLAEFRKHFCIGPRRLAKLAFGDAKATKGIIDDLDSGFIDGGKAHDYRITPYTADYIYFTLTQIFARLSWLRTHPFTVMPVRSLFFIGSHSAGAGVGRRTSALPVSKGNQMQSLAPAIKREITARVDTYAKSLRH